MMSILSKGVQQVNINSKTLAELEQTLKSMEYRRSRRIVREMVNRISDKHKPSKPFVNITSHNNGKVKTRKATIAELATTPNTARQPVFNASFGFSQYTDNGYRRATYLISGNNRMIGHKEATKHRIKKYSTKDISKGIAVTPPKNRVTAPA